MNPIPTKIYTIPTKIYTIPTPNPIPLHMIPNPESNPDSSFDSGFVLWFRIRPLIPDSKSPQVWMLGHVK